MTCNYKVSVVTPFHNVDMGMFEKAYASLRGQTIGFENVQWVIVVHNSDQGYLEAVGELVAGHDNVLIKELNNDAHTPSSPRNYGMRFVEGRYLAFLDGDDSFTPFALERAVVAATAHAADVVMFRREYELESEGLAPVTDVCLWNQTFDEIVMDRAHWDTVRMFSGVWGMVTSRLFDAAFLREHDIVFDEGIPFAEDVDFCASAYACAGTVVYLPQTIGYHYYINGGSLVQSQDKPGETLVGYARGFAKIFGKLLDMGVYADATINGISALLAEYITGSTSITVEQREEIRGLLEPYLDTAGKTLVSKVCSREESERSYSFSREVILNPDASRTGDYAKRRWNGLDVLLEILRENAETDYGVRYQFPMIQTARGYQARVPLADMESYRILADLQMKVGETGIVTSKPTRLFLTKALTTGEQRYFAVTDDYLDEIGQDFLTYIRGRKSALFMSTRFPKRVYNAYATDVTGAMLNYYNGMQYSLVGTGTKVVTPEVLLFPQENVEVMYYQALFALADPDVEQVIASSFWKISEIMDCVQARWESMVSDLETGTVSSSGDCSEEYGRALRAAFVADPERARYLRGVFEDGFDGSTMRRIWPRLTDIKAIGYGSSELYQDRIRRRLDGVRVSIDKLMEPQGLIGVAASEDGVFTLCRDETFYEFIPLDDRKGDVRRPLLTADVVVGERYVLVLTNRLGLYRYDSGMVVEITRNDVDSVQFAFCGYLDEYFEDGDFVLSESEVYEQVAYLNDACDAQITDFAYAIEDRTLRLYFETEENAGITAADCRRALKEHYAEPYFEDMAACKIDNGSQLLYRDYINFKYEISNDRLTPIRLISTEAQRLFFDKCVIEEAAGDV